jgi:tRNA(Ile)-lysidine synthase
VIGFCQQQGVELHRIHFDTKTYASLHKVSIEMAARELRYSYFEQLKKDISASTVCVAHHRDDSVETVLLNLIRGTGIHGLTGIHPRQGQVVRPLLCVSRPEIEAFLQSNGQPYITDSSNLVDDVVRNKIRLNVLPLLRSINPSVSESIHATAQRLTEAERVYHEAISRQLHQLKDHNKLSIKDLLSFSSPEALLFEWLQPFGFNPATVQQIHQHLENPETGRIWSSATHELIINRGYLQVEPKGESLPTMKVPETGCYIYNNRQKLLFKTCDEVVVDRNPAHACLDAKKVSFPLTIRPVQEGDRFMPFGMKGTKLVSDFLTDQKLSLFDRRRQLVITDADGNIVWLVGRRPDQRFCLSGDTSQMLSIEVIV